MSASQFTESQKAQMVEQYRAGHSSVAVGKRFGCSDRTVMRFVRDLVGATEFEALKERNRSAAQRKPASNFTGQFTESQRPGSWSSIALATAVLPWASASVVATGR